MALNLAPVQIKLPPLHSGQVIVAKSPARFKVVVLGRRYGKTTYGVRQCTKGALETRGLYWWVGPSYKVAMIGWKMLKTIGRQIPDTEIREADMSIRFANGGEVCIKSADNPDSLRGEKLSGVVFDEFAQIKEVTWYEVIRPALSDMKGWALFIGTPKGKNWAYRLFERAKTLDDWAAFKIPTAITEDGTANTRVIGSNNPYIDPAELESSRIEMTPEQFSQEFLADFGVSQYLVYSEIVPEVHRWRGPIPKFVSYHGGMDFGGDTIGAHKSCTGIAGLTEKDELIVFAWFEQSGPNIAERQLNWTLEQEAKIEELKRRTQVRSGPVIYRADKSQSLGIQFMKRFGLHVFPTVGGPDSVSEGIELVHRRLKIRPESDNKPKLFWLPDVPWLEDALMRYRYPEPRDEDQVQAKNPLKVNDDTADTLRYLVEGVDRQPIGDPQKLYNALVPRMIQ